MTAFDFLTFKMNAITSMQMMYKYSPYTYLNSGRVLVRFYLEVILQIIEDKNQKDLHIWNIVL